MLYSALYQSKLVPRWISVWGLIAAALLLAGTVLEMLEVFRNFPVAGRELIYAAPIAVNEMVLAVWLIVKGFNPSALEPASAKESDPSVPAQ